MNDRSKDSPWLPVLMPLVVFGAVAIVLPALGIFLLNVALATQDLFHPPVPHSMAVIIVALIISLVIGGAAAFVASRPEKPATPSDHSHSAGHTGH